MTDILTPSREERLEILKSLYPLYKDEVYRRRDQMMRLTVSGSAFLLLLLLTGVWVIPHSFDTIPTVLAVTGVLIFSSLLVYLIIQQRDRHQMAKQTLIDIERALGLYQEGFYLDHQAVYPKDWQTAWLSDRSVSVYIAVITILTILIVTAILLRHPFST